MRVGGVIRLNELLYDDDVFRREGINVYDLEFTDGSCPDDVSYDQFHLLEHYSNFHQHCGLRSVDWQWSRCAL
jgi:hypothetical protein